MKKTITYLFALNVILALIAIGLYVLPERSKHESQAPQSDSIAHDRSKDSVRDDINALKTNVEQQVGRLDARQSLSSESKHAIRKNNEAQSEVSTTNLLDLTKVMSNHPFFKEAALVKSGKLEERDAHQRRIILNYCEHLRTAYTSKDIDFLRQVYSDKALIIIGNVVRQSSQTSGIGVDERVTYTLRTKADYLSRLETVFQANKTINVKFSDFRILRHPSISGIYGVTLRQQYRSDRYHDDGYLFLLWDFRDPTMPIIHIRTWQPSASVTDKQDIIGMGDFILE